MDVRQDLADDFSRKIEEALSFPEWRRWAALLGLGVGLLISAFVIERGLSASAVNAGSGTGAVLADSSSWFDGLADYFLYAVLLGLAAHTLHSNYKDVRRIDEEIKMASRDARSLVECDDIALFLENTHVEAAQGRGSYFRAHIDSLYKIYSVSSEISQDNLVGILHSRLLAKNRKVELLAGVLVTLGLIGTIVGLLVMMAKLKVVIDSGHGGDIQALMGGNGPLSGLSVAFLTTLIAAGFGGVLLKILTGIVEEGITKYVALISELTEVYVLPMLRSHAAELERG